MKFISDSLKGQKDVVKKKKKRLRNKFSLSYLLSFAYHARFLNIRNKEMTKERIPFINFLIIYTTI